MLGDAVENLPHAHDDPAVRDVRLESLGAIGFREDGPIDVLADLARVDIERRDDVDVAGQILADLGVHQACHALTATLGGVVMDALDQRARAVTHASDSDADGSGVGHDASTFP